MRDWKHRGFSALKLAVSGALLVVSVNLLQKSLMASRVSSPTVREGLDLQYQALPHGRATDTFASDLTLLGKITGPGSINQTDTKYQVMGSDLGIMWDSGQGRVMVAFGDTYGQGWGGNGGGPATADWRSNVLALSSDKNPDDGLNFDTMIQDPLGRAKELLNGKRVDHDEVTVIPTAGVTVGTRHYIHYMSVNYWGTPGQWFTNYSGIAYSDDNGESWIKDPGARWINDAAWSNRFQMAAFVNGGGCVYMFGTPNGRFGAAYLARVAKNSLLNKSAYEYWDGAAWRTGNEEAAAPVVIAPVAELSVQYNSHFGRWIMTYFDDRRAAIILRDSPSLTGPWTGQKVLVKGSDFPALYGGYIHPWFNDSDKVYFTMSQWRPYNVFFMRARLTADRLDENILSDPGFEDQPSGAVSAPWLKGGAGDIGSDRGLGHAHSGSNNAYLRATSGYQNIYQDIVVRPKRNYRLTGWVKTSPSLKDGYFGVRPTNDAPPFAEVRYGSSAGTPADVYTPLTVDFNSGTRTSVRVFVGMSGPGSDAFVRSDDIAVNLSSKSIQFHQTGKCGRGK